MLSEPGSYAQLSDEELMEKIKEDDWMAWETFRQRHWKLVYNLCYRDLRNMGWPILEEANDIAVDAFIVVWTKRNLYDRNRGTPKAWVIRIARNRCVDFMREHGRLNVGADDVLDNTEAATMDPETQGMLDDLDEVLLPCFKTLNEQELLVLIMLHIGDHSINEISRVLGLTWKQTNAIYKSALGKLRECMEVSHHG